MLHFLRTTILLVFASAFTSCVADPTLAQQQEKSGTAIDSLSAGSVGASVSVCGVLDKSKGPFGEKYFLYGHKKMVNADNVYLDNILTLQLAPRNFIMYMDGYKEDEISKMKQALDALKPLFDGLRSGDFVRVEGMFDTRTAYYTANAVGTIFVEKVVTCN